MRPWLVILLLVLVEQEISARYTSKEYMSENKYRERTSTNSRHRDDSLEQVVKPKSRSSSKSKPRNDSDEDLMTKPKSKGSGKPSSKKSKDELDFKEKDLPKSPDKDLKPPGKGDSSANTEQLNFKFWNFENLANYQNNRPQVQ